MTHALTILAFDWGLRHIGVAVGQQLIASSAPAAIVKARDGIPDWDAVDKLVREWQPQLFLVGLPLNMDGTESTLSEPARRFSRRLQARYHREVVLVDERLTSREAKSQRRERQDWRDTGRATVDAEAACIILQDFYQQPPRR